MSWFGKDFYKQLDHAQTQYDYLYGDDTYYQQQKERLAKDFEDCYDMTDDDCADYSDEGDNCD